MVEVEFIYNGIKTMIQCDINEKIKNICNKYLIKIGKDIKDIYFVYGGNVINENLKELNINELSNNIDKERKKMILLVNEIDKNKEKKNNIRKSK